MKKQTEFQDLHKPIFYKTSEYLNPRDLLNLSASNKKIQKITDIDMYWKARVLSKFGIEKPDDIIDYKHWYEILSSKYIVVYAKDTDLNDYIVVKYSDYQTFEILNKMIIGEYLEEYDQLNNLVDDDMDHKWVKVASLLSYGKNKYKVIEDKCGIADREMAINISVIKIPDHGPKSKIVPNLVLYKDIESGIISPIKTKKYIALKYKIRI